MDEPCIQLFWCALILESYFDEEVCIDLILPLFVEYLQPQDNHNEIDSSSNQTSLVASS